jgi:hypothetical protein
VSLRAALCIAAREQWLLFPVGMADRLIPLAFILVTALGCGTVRWKGIRAARGGRRRQAEERFTRLVTQREIVAEVSRKKAAQQIAETVGRQRSRL